MIAAGSTYSVGVPVYFVTGLGEFGVAEIAGAKHNPRIVEYLQTTKLPAAGLRDETPWCSAFVNWCMVRSGFKGTGSAAARSWLLWGKPTPMPRLGTVAVLWRDDPDDTTKGHVGLVVRKDGATVWLLGGNQGNKVSILDYPTARVLEYREP